MNKEILNAGIEALTKAIRETPSATLYKERGRLRMLMGDSEGAMDDIKKAANLEPDMLNNINGKFGAK